MKIGWICNSKIVLSESYLLDNLNLLEEIGTVQVHTGNESSIDSRKIFNGNFDAVPTRYWHKLAKLVLGSNPRNIIRQYRCIQSCLKPLQAFRPDFLWIEFGTTAFVCSKLIEKLGIPYIINIHGFDVASAFRDPEYRSAFKKLTCGAHAVVCASRFISNKCIAYGASDSTCHVVDLVVKKNKPQYNLAKLTEHPSFVQFSRLVEVKGTHLTLLAFKRVLTQIPNSRFTIIGDGPQLQSLQKLTKRLKIDHAVTFAGALKQREAQGLIMTHWIFCQHSIPDLMGSQEGFGLTLAESSAAGMPVISTNHGGIPEHIINGKNGLLVDEYDVDSMTAAMLHLTENRELRVKMGREGIRLYSNRFTKEHRRKQLMSILRL